MGKPIRIAVLALSLICSTHGENTNPRQRQSTSQSTSETDQPPSSRRPFQLFWNSVNPWTPQNPSFENFQSNNPLFGAIGNQGFQQPQQNFNNDQNPFNSGGSAWNNPFNQFPGSQGQGQGNFGNSGFQNNPSFFPGLPGNLDKAVFPGGSASGGFPNSPNTNSFQNNPMTSSFGQGAFPSNGGFQNQLGNSQFPGGGFLNNLNSGTVLPNNLNVGGQVRPGQFGSQPGQLGQFGSQTPQLGQFGSQFGLFPFSNSSTQNPFNQGSQFSSNPFQGQNQFNQNPFNQVGQFPSQNPFNQQGNFGSANPFGQNQLQNQFGQNQFPNQFGQNQFTNQFGQNQLPNQVGQNQLPNLFGQNQAPNQQGQLGQNPFQNQQGLIPQNQLPNQQGQFPQQNPFGANQLTGQNQFGQNNPFGQNQVPQNTFGPNQFPQNSFGQFGPNPFGPSQIGSQQPGNFNQLQGMGLNGFPNQFQMNPAFGFQNPLMKQFNPFGSHPALAGSRFGFPFGSFNSMNGSLDNMNRSLPLQQDFLNIPPFLANPFQAPVFGVPLMSNDIRPQNVLGNPTNKSGTEDLRKDTRRFRAFGFSSPEENFIQNTQGGQVPWMNVGGGVFPPLSSEFSERSNQQFDQFGRPAFMTSYPQLQVPAPSFGSTTSLPIEARKINDITKLVPGAPGVDYPVYSQVPETGFSCDGRPPGYYADVKSRCQAFHICIIDANGENMKTSFLCANGTVFNEGLSVCQWWADVPCKESEVPARTQLPNKQNFDGLLTASTEPTSRRAEVVDKISKESTTSATGRQQQPRNLFTPPMMRPPLKIQY